MIIKEESKMSSVPGPAFKIQRKYLYALLLLILLICLYFLARRIDGPVLNTRILNSLIGSTKEDVRNAFGEPSDIKDKRWIYTLFLNQGWVTIDFDENDRVWEINDESPHPYGWWP